MQEKMFLDLSGEWQVRLVGTTQAGPIQLPGILQTQGYGDAVTEKTPFVEGLHDRLWFLREAYRPFVNGEKTLVPFVSQPVRHYLGVAWYQREIEVPASFAGMNLAIELERVRWQSHVWLDERDCGACDSLCVPHRFVVGKVTPGKHTLKIRVDNAMQYQYRPDAHAVSDSEGSTWNGIVGKMQLVATPAVHLADVQVYPDAATKTVRAHVTIANATPATVRADLTLTRVIDGQVQPAATQSLTIPAGQHDFDFTLHYAGATLWDEFHPVLQQLQLQLSVAEAVAERTVTFGLRTIRSVGTALVLNGRKLGLRGTHDAGGFPLTGAPACDLASWRKLMQTCKDWGLNHIRYHSWCPPEAAFVAADEVGMYLQVEPGMWNYFTPGGVIEQQLLRETKQILQAYGNHPSFVMFAASNEPHGDYMPSLIDWVAQCRALDDRHVYAMQSGWFWPQQGGDPNATDYVYTVSRGAARMRGVGGWFGRDFSQHMQGLTKPFVAHELGQWTAYPDFDMIQKFTGYMRPGNYQLFQQSAKAHGVLAQDHAFVMASGKFQQACYKEDIEANMRTLEYSGFSLLDLHDYLGQGGALVGMLDAFWDKKPYVDQAAFKQACAPVVPLARLTRRTYRGDETLRVPVEVYCYAEDDLQATISWTLTSDDGQVCRSGSLGQVQLATGGNTELAPLVVSLAGLTMPASYHLNVVVDGTEYANRWQLWVYPATQVAAVGAVKITADYHQAVAWAQAGARVLFLPASEQLDYNCPPMATEPVFWNSQMGPKWARTLGLLCDPKAPAFAQFPTEDYLSWQWREIVAGSRAINVKGLPSAIVPLIQPIDDWNRNDKLALAFECRVGNGKMLVSSLDLHTHQDARPAAAQLQQSLLAYMNSDAFAPSISVTATELQSFLFDTTVMQRLHATVTVDQPKASADVDQLINGDPNTYWLAGGGYGGHYPFLLEFTVPEAVRVAGLRVMPRQNHRSAEGAVQHFTVATATDGEFVQVASGAMPASFDPFTISFDHPVAVTKLRLQLLDGFSATDVSYWEEKGGFHEKHGAYVDECAALAEVAFVLADGQSVTADAVHVAYQEGKTASKEIY